MNSLLQVLDDAVLHWIILNSSELGSFLILISKFPVPTHDIYQLEEVAYPGKSSEPWNVAYIPYPVDACQLQANSTYIPMLKSKFILSMISNPDLNGAVP